MIPRAEDIAIATPTELRGLPLLDAEELARVTGFVWIVRSFVTVPLTGLGVLATVAAVIVGNVPAAIFSAAITVLIVLSLHHDTQFSKAVELLRRGDLAAAESVLRRLAEAPHRGPPQRQRARSYLVGIAWARGDLEGALQWTRVWLREPEGSEEHYLVAAAEVQLLALLGEHEEAEKALARLPERRRGDRWALTEATCRLVIAFGRGDAEPVRASLDGWVRLCERSDDHGLTTALLAWAHDALGMPERAIGLVHEARGLTALQRQAPAVAQWLAAYDDRALAYR